MGPDMSSSHYKQLFNSPFGFTNGSFIRNDFIQTPKHLDFEYLVLNTQISVQASVNPKFLIH
jgi:hypothetical protein